MKSRMFKQVLAMMMVFLVIFNSLIPYVNAGDDDSTLEVTAGSENNGDGITDELSEDVMSSEPEGAVSSKITITGGIEGSDYIRSADGTITVITSTPIVLDGGSENNTLEQIVLGSSNDAASDIYITIKNLKITKTSATSPLKIVDNFEKDVHITLDGVNELTAGPGCAAIEKNGGPMLGTLTIDGEGSLYANGGANAAGIGGGNNHETANIVIDGGSISVMGGTDAAGIGGGNQGGGRNITINGGTITAKAKVKSASNYGGAGIGGGKDGHGTHITINGGIVSAQGSDGAGIGGGFDGDGSNITINGGTIIAIGGQYHGAGIGGGGNNGSGIGVSITGGVVTAKAGARAAGIGGSLCGYGREISISGGVITLSGGTGGIKNGSECHINDPMPIVKDASIKTDDLVYVDENGTSLYKIAIPHHGESVISYKLSSSSNWNSLSFPAFHENDESYYLWLPEGLYDFKVGSHELHSIPVHTSNVIKVNTRKIVIDDIPGSKLEIMSNNRYAVDGIEYDCSGAMDKYLIEQLSSEPLRSKYIVISDAAEVMINNLNIQPNTSNAALLDLSKTDLCITVHGENTFISPKDHAGIEKNLETGILTLNGDGSITATGGENGAGIGGGKNGSTVGLVFAGCNVAATGGMYAAGIGGGSDGYAKNITISGGIVTASNRSSGAGIGGGQRGKGEDISISGGTVTASGSSGAGIGGGYLGEGIGITISGGIVTADAYSGSAIGGGYYKDGTNITISGGKVKASINYGSGAIKGNGAAIGGGESGAGKNITISGGMISASGRSGDGIGCGYNGVGATIYISGGNIKTSKMSAPAVVSASNKTELKLNKIFGYAEGDQVPFSTIKGANYYNLQDITAFEDGCFYFYLPGSVDVTVYSKCNVSYVTNCDISIPKETVYKGTALSAPTNLKKEGFKLEGWYLYYEIEDGYEYYDDRWNFEYDTVTRDITLYARWVNENDISPETTWQTDYEYSLEGNTIVLSVYLGSEEEICVPAEATIEGITYKTKLYEQFAPGKVKKLSFEKGISIEGDVFWFMKNPDYNCDESENFNPYLEEVDISNLDLRNVKYLENCFSRCNVLKKIDMHNIELPMCINCTEMFDSCPMLEEINTDGVICPNVISVDGMFRGDKSLKHIDLRFITSSQIEDCFDLFKQCTSLESVDLSNMSWENLRDGYCNDVFKDASSLSIIKTPIRIKEGVIIGLPKKYYDKEGNEYTSLPSLGKSITLVDDVSKFEEIENQCKVTFYNDDSSLIKSSMVKKGEYAPVPDEKSLVTRTHPGEEKEWEFDRWAITINGMASNYDPHKEPVTGNTVCTAIFKRKMMYSNSPLNPSFAIDDDTTEMYLVKGQKFSLNDDGWISENKTIVSISKKNVLTAKKVTATPLKLAKGTRTIDVHVSKPSMSAKSISLPAGTTQPIIFNYDKEHLNAYWYSNAPDIATVTQEGVVTTIAKGTATITAYINGSAYNCKVKVTEDIAVSNRTLHMTLDAKKKISIKGIKNVTWISDDESIVKVEKKNRLIAISVGDTVLRTEYQDKEYMIHVYVENPTIISKELQNVGKNKYKVKLSPSSTMQICFSSVEQTVMFKSSKGETAYVDAAGTIHTNRPGKAKLTAKINGKTIIITVTVE